MIEIKDSNGHYKCPICGSITAAPELHRKHCVPPVAPAPPIPPVPEKTEEEMDEQFAEELAEIEAQKMVASIRQQTGCPIPSKPPILPKQTGKVLRLFKAITGQ